MRAPFGVRSMSRSSTLLAPRFWPSWALVGLTWLLARRPARTQQRIARWLAQRLAGSGNGRIAVMRRNLELCFPELTAEQRRQLAREHLHSVLLLAFELLNLIWAPRDEAAGQGIGARP